jgi:hypothetical protein
VPPVGLHPQGGIWEDGGSLRRSPHRGRRSPASRVARLPRLLQPLTGAFPLDPGRPSPSPVGEVAAATLQASLITMDRLWICRDPACEGAAVRSYDDLAASGEPLCPLCDGDMKLTVASCRDFDKVLRGLSKSIRL